MHQQTSASSKIDMASNPPRSFLHILYEPASPPCSSNKTPSSKSSPDSDSSVTSSQSFAEQIERTGIFSTSTLSQNSAYEANVHHRLGQYRVPASNGFLHTLLAPEPRIEEPVEDPFATDMSTVEEDYVGSNEYPTVSSNENEFDESEFHNCHDDVDDFPESEYEPDDDPYDSGYEADGDPYELSDDPDETWFYRMVPEPRRETDQQYYYARKKWYEANSAHEDETESDYETNRWRKTAIADGLLEIDVEDDDDDNENPSSDLLVEVDEDEKIEVPSVQGNGATGNVGGDSAVNEVGKALMEHLGITP